MALDLGTVAVSLVLASVVFALIWSLRLAKNSTASSKKVKETTKKNGTKEVKKDKSAPKKKPASNPPVKETKSQFTHSWLLTTLKGHTSSVLDMDFSPNGKHLATCCEELDDVFEADCPATEPVDNLTPSETDSSSVLSRRQKRNRSKRNKAQSGKKQHQQQIKSRQQPHQQYENQQTKAKQRLRKATPLKYYTRLKMNNPELYNFLSGYVLPINQLLNLGYPYESPLYPDRVIIYKTPEANVTYYRSDARRAFRNQKEDFKMTEHYFGGSGESGDWPQKPPLSPSQEKRCVRCNRGFFVTADGEYLTEESCIYHWGTWKRLNPTGAYGYTCCQKTENAPGCSTGKLHVWNGVSPGLNGPFTDYVRTTSSGRHRSVYALDCEMCYTGQGLEVCKVTVISIDGSLVYETLVRPERPVVDCNTRFSGIDMQALSSTKKRLKEVQDDLMAFISAETILIGHGLENDLRSLRLLHSRVIDTAALFPHYRGIPFRRSLKSLMAAYFQREIQTGSNGHDSFEDARACAELVLWKAATDLRLKSTSSTSTQPMHLA